MSDQLTDNVTRRKVLGQWKAVFHLPNICKLRSLLKHLNFAPSFLRGDHNLFTSLNELLTSTTSTSVLHADMARHLELSPESEGDRSKEVTIFNSIQFNLNKIGLTTGSQPRVKTGHNWGQQWSEEWHKWPIVPSSSYYGLHGYLKLGAHLWHLCDGPSPLMAPGWTCTHNTLLYSF